MVATDFAQYLQALRAAAGYPNRYSLAKAAGIWSLTLYRLEKGQIKQPKPQTLAKLAACLRVPYEDLLARAGYLDPEPSEPSFPINADQVIISDIPEDWAVDVEFIRSGFHSEFTAGERLKLTKLAKVFIKTNTVK